MLSNDGCYALVYNGELYNDAEVRAELVSDGWDQGFRTHSDTETVLAALIRWGVGAITRLRGMFALGFVDTQRQGLLLARDPLGIKPLYYNLHANDGSHREREGTELIFASDVGAILSHPAVSARPDFTAISAYLTTIRTTIGTRTLFEGVRTLRPGEVVQIDLAASRVDDDACVKIQRVERARDRSRATQPTADNAVALVRGAVTDSVARHMRADVPTCILLSGGLDSSIIAACASSSAASEGTALRTYCSGTHAPGSEGDFLYAGQMACHLGAQHSETPVTQCLFTERWHEMVSAQGIPLGTPNEVAINHVARALRADGQVVALSGEGADELFGGYDEPMRLANLFEHARRVWAGSRSVPRPDPGLHQLHSVAWIPIEAKALILNDAVWGTLEADAWLTDFYSAEFAAIEADLPCDDRGFALEPLEPHLRFLRSINLSGLLGRLDTATMLASVEGRTPFADRVVADLAESLPMRWKYDTAMLAASGPHEARGNASCSVATSHTKRVLREAFARDLPDSILHRPKASFALPFQEWMSGSAHVLHESSLIQELVRTPARHSIADQPQSNWRVAWPLINLGLWGKRWWG